MGQPVPTKAFLQLSPDAAMLFAPYGCIHQPPPVPPFLLMQNLQRLLPEVAKHESNCLPQLISSKSCLSKSHHREY